jgi:hypothetical protein
MTKQMRMLSTEDGGDLGLVRVSQATDIAREESDRMGVAVAIRCPITDQVFEVIRPGRK